jgi:hypothetical protein
VIRKSGSGNGRCAHIRVQARREAIATLERTQKSGEFLALRQGRAQNWAQAPNTMDEPSSDEDDYLKAKDLSLVGVAGFEPATTRTPSVCATRLRHTPTVPKAVRIAATREKYSGSTERKTISSRGEPHQLGTRNLGNAIR